MQNPLQLENSLFSGHLDSPRHIPRDLKCASSIKSDLFFFEKQLQKPKKTPFPEHKLADPSEIHRDNSIWLGNDKQLPKRPNAPFHQLNSPKASSKIEFEQIPATISPPEFRDQENEVRLGLVGQGGRKLSLDQNQSRGFSMIHASRMGNLFLNGAIKRKQWNRENDEMKAGVGYKNRKWSCSSRDSMRNKNRVRGFQFGLFSKMGIGRNDGKCGHGEKKKCLDLEINTLRQFEEKCERKGSDLMKPQMKGKWCTANAKIGCNLWPKTEFGVNSNDPENEANPEKKMGLIIGKKFVSKITKKGVNPREAKCFGNSKKVSIFKKEYLNSEKIENNFADQKQRKLRKSICKKEPKQWLKRLKQQKTRSSAKEIYAREKQKMLISPNKFQISKSEKSFKTCSSKETVLELESKIKPSILTFFDLMVNFCDEMIAYLQHSGSELIKGSELMVLFVKYIMQLRIRGVRMDQLVVDDQIKVLQSLAKDFRVSDLEFIKKFFLLSRTISSNYEGAEKYFVDKDTRIVYLKVCKQNENETNFSRNSFFNERNSNLVGLNDYFQQNREQLKQTSMRVSQSPPHATQNRESLLRQKPVKLTLAQPILKKTESSQKTPKKGLKKPKKGRKKIKKKKAAKHCKCSKSKCLRLHCSCFRSGKFCGDECNCKGCFNKTEFKTLVQNVISFTKNINPQAFEKRILEFEQDGKRVQVMSGCSCSKNNCLKNYCECRKNGLGCSALCKCENCQNFKVDLDPVLANSLYKNPSRKKKKIIFQKNNKDSLEMVEKVLMNKYRRV